MVLMARRATGSRAEAVRRAKELRASREAARARLDDQIETQTAALLGAVLEAERVRGRARVAAEKVLADGEASASEFERQAASSVRALRELNLTNGEIAEQCGLSVSALRGLLAQTRTDGPVNVDNEANTPMARSPLRAGHGGSLPADADPFGGRGRDEAEESRRWSLQRTA
ncbi:hypothetical protein GCM10009839_34020 [Catenulispora yoronensis]|uniref:Uncharacterized protein n=1 Tax=Catenulispora yoronensis TaxID=450799 RepID=A0ABN2U907_9ACTN